MNQHTTIAAADVAPSDTHLRLLASAILNGQFDGVDCTYYEKTDWVDVAQWFADTFAETDDEAQALGEMSYMLAKSDFYQRWQNLSDRQKDEWVDYGNYWSALGKPAFERGDAL